MTAVAYRGRRIDVGDTQVWIEDNGQWSRALRHHVRHSPDGFEWGYGGSGPSDLALAILWDCLGEEPPRAMYMDFKFKIIASLRTDDWAISQAAVKSWIARWQARAEQDGE